MALVNNSRRGFVIFKNPFQKSAAQLAKLQKKLDKEKAEMDRYEEVQKYEHTGKFFINQEVFYGKQMNKYPQRKDQEKIKQQFDKEIKRQT